MLPSSAVPWHTGEVALTCANWAACFAPEPVFVCCCCAGRVENSMRASMHILQGSFDPIMDANNNTDLLPLIIQAKVGRAA